MTDSMNFGPEWLRNLSSDGSTTGGTGGAIRYQLSGFRYGREEMLGLYEKGFKPPASLVNFTTLYTDPPLVPLLLITTTEEERMWQNRPPPLTSSTRGSRGSSLERGGARSNRGRGSYQYGRSVGSGYETSGGGGGVNWGNGEQQEWSPRKDYNYRSSSADNWRRSRTMPDDEEGWRSTSNRAQAEKWGRSMSWRDGDKDDDRGGPHERNRNWHEGRGHVQRRGWDEDHQQPEWFTEQLGEGGGTFDSSGAYHGSDDEQDHRGNGRKELQKSASQQNISPRQPAPLASSKSSVSLSKQLEIDVKEDKVETPKKEVQDTKDRQDPPEKLKVEDKQNLVEPKMEESEEKIQIPPNLKIESNGGNININGVVLDQGPSPNRVEEDFDRLQEDLVSKLVVEEETPKAPMNPNLGMPGVGVTPQPPPNLVPPIQDKWYYQDPQGDLQGPFVSTEMAEWFKAGYFTLSLLVRRQCDKTFYTLGDLVRICNGGNPFKATTRMPPLKEVLPVKIPEQDHLLNLQYLQTQMAMRSRYKPVPTDWANLTALQQRDMLAQHLMPQAQMTPVELQYFQQSAQPPPPAANPLMHIINQMQQVNKLSGQPMADQANAMPMQMDSLQALVQQMHSLQRIQPGASALPGMGIPQPMPSENLINNMSGMHGNLSGPGLTGIPSNMPSSGVLPGPIPQKPLENLTTPTDDNPINNLLRQLQNKNISQPQPLDALWQQNQFVTSQSTNQWQQPPVQATQPPPQSQPQQQQQQPPAPPQQPKPPQPEAPISMWDLPPPSQMGANSPTEAVPPSTDELHRPQAQNKEKEALAIRKEKDFVKEEKKRKEQEERQQKKEAEEKRKQEQRRLEMEKKAAEEKKKKEEERIRKELEKARKEAEEKRLRELEEKRKLKEARKAEEEARKRAEEQKRLEEEQEKEKAKEDAKRAMTRVTQENQYKSSSTVKAAPWSQSSVATGPSFVDIQKAEREKRVEQALLQQQQRQLHLQEQQTIEKASSLQLNWANKPIQPRHVKSLAEIQAEEQELLAKQAAERLAQQQKEKENNTVHVPTGIWQGQNLTWANTASQWSSSNVTGFWDDVPSQKVVSKPSNVVKSNSTSAMASAPKPQQQSKPAKSKTKRDEAGPKNNGSATTNGPATEEFTQWCIKALSNVTSTVDSTCVGTKSALPTFIGFLKDIESAAEVKDYCREYLGESQAMHQFTAQFLEKRRSFRPKTNAHKDDMCCPAPAITPSMQHNSDFQEVKGKGKKSKKSKMTKVDARILGFNVTAAQDRINVGDRDYGDN